MPFVDRIIQFMQTQAGERVVLVNDRECVLYRPGGSSTTIPQRFTQAQIGSLLNEIMTDEQRHRFAAGESLTFPYDAGGSATDIEVSRDNATLRVCITANAARVAPATGAEDRREPEAPYPPVPAPQPPEPPATRAPEPAAPTHTATRGKVEHIDELLRLLVEREASD